MAAQLDDSQVLVNKLYEGYLHKKGKLNKSWKKRYFILYLDRKLKYYSTKPSTASDKEIGFINLHLVTGISTHQFDNTHTVYEVNNPDITKNATYYEEQKTYHSLKDNQKSEKTSSSASSQIVEFIFKLYTPKRIWHLKCADAAAMTAWSTKVKATVYGHILHEAHLLIDNANNKWKARWCVLTDKYHLRIYEDETQSKYKDCVKMEQLNMITYNDRERFRYFNNRREYAVKLSRSDKQFQIATLSHKSRQVWMDKFSHLMQDELHKMEILREGYVWVFEQCEDGLKRWDKRYCGIDSNSYLYFADDFDVFRCFANGLYFDLNVFEEEKRRELDGYLSLFEGDNRFKCGYASNYQIFNGTTQQHNNNIFYMKFKQELKVEKQDCDILNFAAIGNIIYFATTSSVELKSWIQCLSSVQREYYKKHAAMSSIQENDKYEAKIEQEEDKYAQIQSMMEAMPFYSSSRISISITQSCIDMELNIHDIVAKKEAVWSNSWKEMNNLCNGYIECEDECKSITECPCFQRMSFVMQFYDDWCCTKKQLLLIIKSPKSPAAVTRSDHNIEDGIYEYLNDYFSGYSSLKLIEDYYHIYTYHKYNDSDFAFIYSHLPSVNYASDSQKCNVLMCDMIRRNERCRGRAKISYFGYTDIKQITCMQLLDRLHSVLYHSFDLFRLSMKEKDIINENMKSNEDEYDSQDSNASNHNKYIDHNFYTMHKMMKSKQTKLIQIRTQLNRNQNKFITDVPSYDDIADECESKTDEIGHGVDAFGLHSHRFGMHKLGRSQSVQSRKKKSHTKNLSFNKLATLDTTMLNIGSLSRNNENMNTFGVKFTYWKQDKQTDENVIYVTAKYANLKQEILSNVMCCIERMDWDYTFFTAQNFMQCAHCKAFTADLTEAQVRKYKIGDGDGIVINHLQSLLLYCNFGDTLHKYLTFTYRKYSHTNSADILSFHELKKRHSEFVNWAKYLTEFVTIFGKNIHKTSEFYHGLQSKYKFNDFRIYYAYPISVTQKLNISTHFVSTKGIILSLNRSEMMSGPKIINCSFLSEMEYEEEVLLMFCNKRPLKITSIVELNTSYSYYYHLCAINILHDIINGRKINKMKVKSLNRLYQLLQYKFNTGGGAEEEINYDELKMGYISKLFISYCNHQDNLIKFDVKLIQNTSVASFFIDINNENCLRMDSLIKLFPNSKAFEIKCPVLHSQTFDSIIKVLNDGLIKNINAQIYQITFKWVQQGNIDNIIEKYGKEFEKYKWTIKKKHKYGFDYINIKRNH